MAFDLELAIRIRKLLASRKGVVEKQMFGGIAFLLRGNMCCGVHQDTLIVRVPPDATDASLKRPHTRLFDLTGRPMKGWLLVDAKGLAKDADLKRWVKVAADYAGSLPAKKK